MQKLKLFGIKTEIGIFICDELTSYYQSSLHRYYFDGNIPENTFKQNWKLIKDIPKKIEIEVGQPSINHRYELNEGFPITEKTPAVIAKEDIEYDEDGDVISWHRDILKVYTFKSDQQPNILQDVEFDFTLIAELEDFKLTQVYYPIQKGSITNDNIIHQLIDTIVFHPVVLETKKCKLSSKDSYAIIREHLKRNIDPKVASMTDYDFCLTVNKHIQLNEELIEKININSGTRKKAKIVTKFHKKRSAIVFKCAPDLGTNRKNVYEGYEECISFEGENYEDLQKNIDSYLKELIDHINKPLEDCPHCDGHGVIEIKKIDI